MALHRPEDSKEVKALKDRINELANKLYNLEHRVREFFYARDDNDSPRVKFWRGEMKKAVGTKKREPYNA